MQPILLGANFPVCATKSPLLTVQPELPLYSRIGPCKFRGLCQLAESVYHGVGFQSAEQIVVQVQTQPYHFTHSLRQRIENSND